MKGGWSIGIAVVLVIAGTQQVPAQTQASPLLPVPQPAPRQAVRVGVAGPPLTLSLADAIQMTLERNNDVVIAKLETRVARQNVLAAEGIYDPRVTPNFSYERTVNANTSAIGGATEGRLEQNEFAGGAGLIGRTPWAGGRFTVNFSSSRVETSNQFARLNPQFPSSLATTYLQPLFRGRAIDADRRNILLARRTVDLNDAQLTQVVMDQLTLVEQAYWDLAFTVRNLEVLDSALTQARAQVESNERQAKEGTLAPIDVVEAQTQVSRFQLAVASGEQALTEAENRLKRLMLADRSAAEWNRPIVPAELADRVAPPIALDEAVKLALMRRPELQALDSTRAQNDVDRAFFRDQTKPLVNVVGGYTITGLAGDPLSTTTQPPVSSGSSSDAALLARLNELSVLAGLTPLDTPAPSASTAVPPLFIGGWGQSLNNLLARRFPTALVQLQMDVPFRNSTARANLARTEIEATQLTRQRQALEQAIEVEVRDSLQAVRSSEQRLAAASAARRYALEQYESERRRFDSGISTVFLVLERQTTFVTAQASELRARADLNQAIAQLERAVGGTLELHGVKLQS
ncbi:MAG TPA: TolC family protein [Vicinamibacterales bacterium]|nr:TolC family protein [Vicinamibacterales bacterium]